MFVDCIRSTSKADFDSEWERVRETGDSVSFVHASDSKNDLVNKPIFTCCQSLRRHGGKLAMMHSDNMLFIRECDGNKLLKNTHTHTLAHTHTQ